MADYTPTTEEVRNNHRAGVPSSQWNKGDECFDRWLEAVKREAKGEAVAVSTVEELDALPIGSVIAYIGDEPDSPSVACRAVRGWQFIGGDPDVRYHSSALAPTDVPLAVLYNPSTYRKTPETGDSK